MVKEIILDTNILMAISQFKLDILSEISTFVDFNYKIKILDKTLDELGKILAEQKGKNKLAAKFALLFIQRTKISKIKTEEGGVDDLLVKKAAQGSIVLTQDQELKRRIKDVGGKILTIRQKKKLVWG